MSAFITTPIKFMTSSQTPAPAPLFNQPLQDNKLGAQDVHIYCLDIRRFSADHYTDAERMMSCTERERALKFVRGKESYIASRWLQRRVLARYTNLDPEQVELLRTDKGKPYLAQANIHFSLSHSGPWALLAVADTDRIGIDIEAVAPTRDLLGIAESYFHPQEFSQLESMDDRARHDYFYRLWTLKEAFFKALGTGISAGLEKIAFDLTGDNIRAQTATVLDENVAEWQFQQWTLSEQDYCALACKRPHPLRVSWFDALSAPAFP